MSSKLTVGDIVFIHPQASMRFGGRWGKLELLNGSRDGCGVSFQDNGFKFRFSRDEVIKLSDYVKILMQCSSQMARHLPTSTDYKVSSLTPGSAPNTFKINEITAHITELYPVMSCSVCGRDTTNEFSHTCLDCSNPID